MEDTISLSRLTDMIIVYGFIGIIAAFIGAGLGDFILWLGGKIRKKLENSR